MAVRRYQYERETDLGDVELDDHMRHRTEGVRAGRRQAASVKHRKLPHSRRKKRRARSRS